MANKKYYEAAEVYEQKLKRVMDRLGVTEYRYDWNRRETYDFDYAEYGKTWFAYTHPPTK